MFVHFVQETVKTLEETQRELRVELEVLRKSKKDLKDRNEGLLKESVRLVFYRLIFSRM